MNVQKSEFVRSAAGPEGFLRDGLPQAVFAGRSNAGKSSVINCLLNRKNFARVGGAPGKTVQINYFRVDGALYLVDLPGYGYARVSRGEKERWGRLMADYFAEPERISLGILIVDARHQPTADDRVMADWFRETGRPFLVAANKTDKLKTVEIPARLEAIQAALGGEQVRVIPFSAEKGTSRGLLLGELAALCGPGRS